jgi:NCS1 family nucleobase:cation symporter-1
VTETTGAAHVTQGELQAAADAKLSMLPILPGERIWGGWDFTIVMAALAIATWTFLTGGFVGSIVAGPAGILAVTAGQLVGFAIVVPAGSLGSTKYGVDLYIQMRAMFGVRGAATLGLAVVVFGVWFNNAAIFPMLGKSVANITQVWVPMSEDAAYWYAAVVGIAALVFVWWICRKGPNFIKNLDWVIVPGLIAVMAMLVYFIFTDYGWNAIATAEPSGPWADTQTMYVLAFETGLGFGISWYWIMGALTRIVKTQRGAIAGFYWGSFIPSAVAIAIGLMTALVVGSIDPTEWMVELAGPALGVIALIFIILANVSSGAIMVYTGTVALRQLKWGRARSWSLLTFIVVLPAIITMLVQDLIYSRMGMVMAVWAVMFIPMCAAVWIDYHVLRKQHLSLDSMYDTSDQGGYWYWKGFNPAFFITLVASVLFYVFVFIDPIHLEPATGIYKWTGSSLPTLAFAIVVYYALTKLWIIPKGWGEYPQLAKEPAARKAEAARLKQTI